MISSLFGLFRRNHKELVHPIQRTKRFFDAGPDHLYAIGDIHGCDDLLAVMEAKILEDARHRDGTKWLVMLGDYVDRGPKSASVLDRLAGRPPEGFTRICLAGNHEEVMLNFLRNPGTDHRWLDFGGLETLRSYGIHKLPGNRQAIRNMLLSYIPPEHIEFLEQLPSLVSIPGYCLVHAGIRENKPLNEQDDATLLWLRHRAIEKKATERDFMVIHGHTPISAVEITDGRLNIDTGAYMSGKLSAVRLSRDKKPVLLQCSL